MGKEVYSGSPQSDDERMPPQYHPGRRRFLRSSAVVSGMLVAQGAIGLLAPSLSWALEVSKIDQKQADTILRLAKVLYPHEGLEDAVYALVVKDMDAHAAERDGRTLVASGVQALDAKAGGAWLEAPPARQREIVGLLIADPFVQKVRATCITTLYNNDMAFAHFGYEGEAFSKGGYVHRGFNDLTWLPAPPADASPPIAHTS
jgi:hypothetical protein